MSKIREFIASEIDATPKREEFALLVLTPLGERQVTRLSGKPEDIIARLEEAAMGECARASGNIRLVVRALDKTRAVLRDSPPIRVQGQGQGDTEPQDQRVALIQQMIEQAKSTGGLAEKACQMAFDLNERLTANLTDANKTIESLRGQLADRSFLLGEQDDTEHKRAELQLRRDVAERGFELLGKIGPAFLAAVPATVSALKPPSPIPQNQSLPPAQSKFSALRAVAGTLTDGEIEALLTWVLGHPEVAEQIEKLLGPDRAIAIAAAIAKG